MAKYYLRMEGVNLNNFVYETQNLSTIRGGGLLLLKAVDDVATRFTVLRTISTGASIGLFSFDADEGAATQLRNDVRAYLQADNSYKHATFVVDIVQDKGDFTRNREELLALNRWQQMTSLQMTVPIYNCDDSIGVCQVDLVRPATHPGLPMQGEEKNVSDSVFTRHDFGRTKKNEFIKQELKKAGVESLVKFDFAPHFNTLTQDAINEKGNLANKMAVIYLDGNDFSTLQNGLIEADLKKFDEKIKAFRLEWLTRLMADLNAADDWIVKDKEDLNTYYRLELLLWGGDELCVVVPAWKGREVVEQFYEISTNWKLEKNEFPSATWNSEAKFLKHGVGIVFCNHKAPIRRMKKLAEDLASAAKDKDRTENYFAYEILESFDNAGLSFEMHRKKACPPACQPGEDKPDAMVLAGDTLKAAIAAMKNIREFIPRRKLIEIVRLLFIAKPKDGATEALKKLQKQVLAQIPTPHDPDVKTLISCLGGETLWWVHVNALWDYVD